MAVQAAQFQQEYQHHDHDDFNTDTVESPISWQPPLTSSTLQQLRRNDANDQTFQPVTPNMSRRTSLDSDRYSTVSGLTYYFPGNPLNVNPAPAYVAPFGASQVVSEHLSATRRPSIDEDEEDEKLNKDEVQFTEQALALINAFMDQLLYSFLSTARSTSMVALRPAVTDVLKHRLATEAIASADEELAELLAGGDDEEETDTGHKTAEDGRRWDLELVWKRTRLRVMVYMRLGEMEDEDEQRYVKDEELFHGSERRFSQTSGLVSWAAAIFLTSILEHVAEQTLQVAGQAACTRVRRQSRTQRSLHVDAQRSEDLVVEEYDVEKVALNSTLGRLWRTWRKALRHNTTPSTPTHRSSLSQGRMSRDNTFSTPSNRHTSYDTANEGSNVGDYRPISRDQKDETAEMEYPEYVLASNIPLPMGDPSRDIDEIYISGLARDPDAASDDEDSPDVPYLEHTLGQLVPLPIGDGNRDVDEIEVPGLARDPDTIEDGVSTAPLLEVPRRRNSFAGVMQSNPISSLPTSDDIDSRSPIQAKTPHLGRQRSMSLPTSARVLGVTEASQSVDENRGLVLCPEEAQDTEKGLYNEDAPVHAKEVEVLSTNGSVEDKSKTAFPWMIGGAAAASAAAASAWAFGSKNTEPEQVSESNEQAQSVPQSVAKFLGSRGFGGLIDSANQDDGSKEGQNMRERWLDVKTDSSQRSLSEEDVEELDKRKSLIDIKSMMVVNGPSSPASGHESPEKSRTPPNAERRTSESSSQLRDTPALGGKDKIDGDSDAKRTDDAIGVARAADVAPALAPAAMIATAPGLEKQEARMAEERLPRLVLGDAPDDGELDDSNVEQAQPPTPRTELRQFLDLSSKEKVLDEQEDHPRTPSSPSQLASLSNGARQSSSIGSSPYQQSFAAPVEKDGSPAQKTQSSELQVHDHPAVQEMASSRGNESKSPHLPKPSNESDKAVPLTSASIRGPEDFDMFIQGGETAKYTLTPENVGQHPILDAAPHSRAAGSPVEMDAVSQSRVGRSNTSRQATSATAEEDGKSSRRRSISKPPQRNTSSHSKTGLLAREPRVLTESTRDFADFIRSTGPRKETSVYPIMANASTTSLQSLRSAHINGASASRSSSPGRDQSRSQSRLGAEGANVPPVPPIPTKSRPAMQPRGPTSAGHGSAELIDFIRSGPEQSGTHRISRTVAPFRTTMDSDQLKDFGDRISTDKAAGSRLTTGAPSVQTTSSMVSSSQRTSANSRSALLNNTSNANHTVQSAYSGRPQKLSNTLSVGSLNNASQENEPVRKRHRNKDPYAMYYDDEDDEEFMTSLPKPTRREESLMDFLSNNEPPADNSPRPLINPNSAQAQNIINNARANGGSSVRSVNTADPGKRTISNPAGPRSGYASPAGSIRQGTITSSASPRSTGGPKLQARGGAKDISQNSNTKELADFFKSSGPQNPPSAPAPFIGRDSKLTAKDVEKAKKKGDKKSIGGFFGRSRKKNYLDMP